MDSPTLMETGCFQSCAMVYFSPPVFSPGSWPSYEEDHPLPWLQGLSVLSVSDLLTSLSRLLAPSPLALQWPQHVSPWGPVSWAQHPPGGLCSRCDRSQWHEFIREGIDGSAVSMSGLAFLTPAPRENPLCTCRDEGLARVCPGGRTQHQIFRLYSVSAEFAGTYSRRQGPW